MRKSAGGIEEAVRLAGQVTGQGNPARILIGGSLYLAGNVLALHRGETPSQVSGHGEALKRKRPRTMGARPRCPIMPENQIEDLIQSAILPFGLAPTCVAATSPPLNTIRVGMPRTPYLDGSGRVFVDVDLDDLHVAAKLVGQFFQRRADHLARAAPLSPEIHDHGGVGLEHIVFKGRIGNRVGGH